MTSFVVIREGIVVTVNLAQAKAHLSQLLDQVEGGEDVVITRYGRPIAQISAIAKPKQPVRSLRAFRAGMPHWRDSSANLLRAMRDESP